MCIVRQELIQNSANRLAKLSAKWEEVRAPLLEQYRALRVEIEGRESEEEKVLGEVARMRGRMKEVADETRQKENLYKQLVSAFTNFHIVGYVVCVCVGE